MQENKKNSLALKILDVLVLVDTKPQKALYLDNVRKT